VPTSISGFRVLTGPPEIGNPLPREPFPAHLIALVAPQNQYPVVVFSLVKPHMVAPGPGHYHHTAQPSILQFHSPVPPGGRSRAIGAFETCLLYAPVYEGAAPRRLILLVIRRSQVSAFQILHNPRIALRPRYLRLAHLPPGYLQPFGNRSS